MFDNLTLVPQTLEEAGSMSLPLSDINEKLRNIIPTDNAYSIHQGDYRLTYISETITRLGAIKASINEKSTYRYYVGNFNRFLRGIRAEDNDYGLLINEEASTHFSTEEITEARYLESAQDHLKQTPTHFLKIFTMPTSNKLFVYTNKPLEVVTIYKLFLLDAATNKRDNGTAIDFVTACVANDLNKVKEVLEGFLNSDEIREIEFKKFRSCLASDTELRISRMVNQIEGHRREIHDYENTIAALATQIRELNDNIAFIRNTKESDESDRILFKYLNKHPYIKHFRATNDGKLHLYYEAPLIYFSEDPAMKMLEQEYREGRDKQILQIILGRKYELMTRCNLVFDTSSFRLGVEELSGSTRILPHPHIDRYHCFGNHRTEIERSAESGDYLGAIEQISQAVLNLNFYDGCVINEMLVQLKRKWDLYATWRNKETGVLLTTAEVVESGDYYEET